MADSTQTLAQVMGRIAKIRELATKGVAGEAEVASAKMAELLLKHNLTMADIDRFAERTNRRVTEEDYDFRANRWRQDLLFRVADAHLCKAIRYTGFQPRSHWCRMQVVGHEHNLIVCRETWVWLQKEIQRLANVAVRDAAAKGDWFAKYRRESWVRDFQHGAVAGIASSYRAMRKAVQAEVGEQWGLVPVLEGEVAARFQELHPTTGKMGGVRRPGYDAFAMGVEAGQGINLDRQVAASKAEALCA